MRGTSKYFMTDSSVHIKPSGELKESVAHVLVLNFVLKRYLVSLGDHLFSKSANISGKLIFFTPNTQPYVCVSGGKKC